MSFNIKNGNKQLYKIYQNGELKYLQTITNKINWLFLFAFVYGFVYLFLFIGFIFILDHFYKNIN